jgi:4-hydroxybenzoate polyprenyltransferase
MATAVGGFRAFRVYLEMIKIEHSVFALPFAMVGMMWGSLVALNRAWPGWAPFLWIVVAMVSSRSAAMAFNRIADRNVDALNPRTRMRALPSGLLRLRQANLFFYASVAIFLLAAAMLNSLALSLAPIALIVTLGYSLTKRFTPLCHFVLGLSLGIAPAAAYIGAAARLDGWVVALSGAVLFWTAGFDIIYALQDEEFDRQHGLRSLPETLGKSHALGVSRVCHALAVGLIVLAGYLFEAGTWWYLGAGFAGLMLAYEQSLVKPGDLSRVNVAFFTLNGFVSIGVFGFALMDVLFG